MRGPRIRLPVAGLAVLALSLLGCGGDNPKLIPDRDAQALLSSIDGVATAVDDGSCDVAQQRLQRARAELDGLPNAVAQSLRDRIGQGLDHLAERIPQDCNPVNGTPTSTPAPTETPPPTATPSLPPSPSPSVVPPLETPTPTPSETPAPESTPPVQPDAGGGVSGGQDGNSQ